VCTAQIDEDCFSSDAEEFKGSKDEKVVVAVQAKMIVGYIRFSIEDEQVYLANVCTAEDARGEKICQKMVRWLTKKLPRYKRDKITLIAANETAARCYEKVGFKDDGGSYMVYTKPATRRRRRRKSKKA
jgi:predicted GNAT family N-acyltransferase